MSRPAAAALLALALSASTAAAERPAPEGWVTDRADLLTADQERALEALMESYRAGSQNEIALLTVPDLGGRPIESVALEVGRAWGLGQKERSNGALLLVARDERKLRIEVGRGLEGALTDSISGRIIRDVIAPQFKQNHYYEGLRAGIEALHAAAGGDYGKLPRPARGGRSGLSLLVLLFLIFLVLGRGGRGRGTGGLLPWLILGSLTSGRRGGRSSGWHVGGGGGGGFGGFGGGGGFSGGGASGGW